MSAIAKDIWKSIDNFHDNVTLSIIARVSKKCNKRTKGLLVKRKQEKKVEDMALYRQAVFTSLKLDAIMSLPPHLRSVSTRIMRVPTGEYKCLVVAIGEAGGEHGNFTDVPPPDASDEYEDALQRACDLHAVFLYEAFGPL